MLPWSDFGLALPFGSNIDRVGKRPKWCAEVDHGGTVRGGIEEVGIYGLSDRRAGGATQKIAKCVGFLEITDDRVEHLE